MISAKWMASAESWPKRSITNYTNPVAIKIPLNIPNVLTWLRIAAIPLFVAALVFSGSVLRTDQVDIVFPGIFIGARAGHRPGGFLAGRCEQTGAAGGV